MIDVKSAVQAAKRFLLEVLHPEEEIEGLRLEEISLADDESYWDVTLGFLRRDANGHATGPSASTSPLVQALNTLAPPSRVYKVIRIDAQSGQPISMKIRTV